VGVKLRFSCAWIAVGAILVACEAETKFKEIKEPWKKMVERVGPEVALKRLNDACPQNSWLGKPIVPDKPCPEALASPNGRWRLTEDPQRTCAYEWISVEGKPSTPDIEALMKLGLRLERDCQVVSAEAYEAGANFPEAMNAERIGRLIARHMRELDCPLPSEDEPTVDTFKKSPWLSCVGPWLAPQRKTRVAVIDSAKFRITVGESRSHHATVVGRTITRISGPFIEIHGHKALPRSRVSDQDVLFEDALGGHMGKWEDLAAAIREATNGWDPTNENLILNLSLGWSSAFNSDEKGLENLGPAHVKALLDDAVCKGALVIAAAGNRSTKDEVGPLYPAAWEQERPTCSSKLKDGYAPRVHAIGGVGWSRRPLAKTRAGALPRLTAASEAYPGYRNAATEAMIEDQTIELLKKWNLAPNFGFDPSTDLPDFDDLNEVLEVGPSTQSTLQNVDFGAGAANYSGTSIAAASASGVAALIWALRPELRAVTVMDILYESAVPVRAQSKAGTVSWTASFGLSDQKAPVKRISVCHALHIACAGDACKKVSRAELNERCPCKSKEESCTPSYRWDQLMPELIAPTGPLMTQDKKELTTLLDNNPDTSGQLGTIETPYTMPQPGNVRCSGCLLALHAAPTHLYASIKPIEGEVISKIRTVRFDAQGKAYYNTFTASPNVAQNYYFEESPAQTIVSGVVEFYNGSSQYIGSEEMHMMP
jgi:hypothetical protein